ncbi:hypothetical protein BH24DEI2_BH24DEI2_11950 [soil metagenome]
MKQCEVKRVPLEAAHPSVLEPEPATSEPEQPVGRAAYDWRLGDPQ